jgi:hypothetical protein
MALLLLLALATKHFIVDFPLQAFPYQYTNKGTYLHPGGLLHSGLHVCGTYLAVVLFVAHPGLAVWMALLDGVVHYHIDWAKMNINRIYKWGPTTHEQFWSLLGFDQYLHMLTYLGIVWILV